MQIVTISAETVELQEVSTVRRTGLKEFHDALTRQNGIQTPVLPSGCILYAARGRVSLFVVECPPKKRTVRYKEDNGGVQEFVVPFPWTEIFITFTEEAMNRLLVFFSPSRIRLPSNQLLHAPLPNRYSRGDVCMGSEFPYQISSTVPDKVEEAVKWFFESTSNTDIQESYHGFMPGEVKELTEEGETFLRGWERVKPERVADLSWTEAGTLEAIVEDILGRSS